MVSDVPQVPRIVKENLIISIYAAYRRRDGEIACGRIADLIPKDLLLGIVLKVPIPLKAAFDNLAEFSRKEFMVEEMMHPEAGARGFARVRRADALLGRADARPAELDLLEAVDDLMKVEDELRAVRDEEPPGAVEPCAPAGA